MGNLGLFAFTARQGLFVSNFHFMSLLRLQRYNVTPHTVSDTIGWYSTRSLLKAYEESQLRVGDTNRNDFAICRLHQCSRRSKSRSC